MIRPVRLLDGRTELEYPDTQIVEWMLACVTRGSATPGVRAGSGTAMNVVVAGGVVGEGFVVVEGAGAAVVDVVAGGCVADGCVVGATPTVGAAVVVTRALVEVAFADALLVEADPSQPAAPTTMSAARMPPPTTCFATTRQPYGRGSDPAMTLSRHLAKSGRTS